ncbi:MAG: hypothetical protein LC732_01775 [Acidobacteria bacterium]|nr:hypothetical protein [Acidobacteriota bacterium]
MAADPVYVNLGDQVCSGCGLPSVVKVEDRPMCGHCFHLGISATQSRKLHVAAMPDENPPEAPIEDAMRAALGDIEQLRARIDSFLQSLDAQGIR